VENMSDERRAVLTAVCDTVVPAIEHEPDPHGLWARSASSMGVDDAAADAIAAMPPAQRDGFGELLDALAGQGFVGRSQASREQLLRNIALVGGTPALVGVGGLIRLTLALAYGMPDPSTGRNPMWSAWGYPGPVTAEPASDEPLRTWSPSADGDELEADVAIVGSGAGGGVLAGTLAQRGLRVVVLEAGPHLTERDFLQLELPAYQQAYWRGGPQPTADFNFTLLAGATLGGGTTINWTNCLRTPQWVRDEWSAAGLEDVGGDFDGHLDSVWERSGVNDGCSEPNGTQQRMREGAQRLGWHWSVATRNVDPARFDQDSGGFIGFGDRTGAKRSTLKTYLVDAVAAGAVVVADCSAREVLVEGGRAAGVAAVWTDRASGRRISLTVRAPHVVCAAGALETPALLLRSGIGGPAVGRDLHLHPTIAMSGVYGEDLRAWSGAPHAVLVDEFESGADAEGFGFRIEGTQYAPGLIGSATPFTTAAEHRRQMERMASTGTFLARIRDHGGGTVTLDAAGEAEVRYALTDPIDVRTMHRAFGALARLHVAAGASELVLLAATPPVWRAGDDLDAYLARLRRLPLRLGGVTLFSAHQMGSCRMGADPATSVADVRGELHDTPGVWIGDASAFPTATGTNPMISVMALAHRTAEAIAHAAGASRPAASVPV